MPRLSEEEDSSDSDSDSSSVYSIPDDPSSNAKETHTLMVGGGYATEYFVTGGGHVSGKLVDNRSKRRLRSHSNDGRAAKVQRLGSPDVGLTQDELDALNRQDSADSDYETAEDDEDDDEGGEEDQLLEPKPGNTPPRVTPLEPIPPRPAVLPPSTRSHPRWPQRQSSGVQSRPQPANSNANVITAYELMRKRLPHLRVAKEDVNWRLRFLTDLPAKREPIMTGAFNINKPQNIVSYLVQASGELLPKEEACEMCRTTRGVYDGCVVSRDPIINESFRGACARCWYSRQGFKCSFRHGELGEEDMSDEDIRLSNRHKDFTENPPAPVPEKKQELSQKSNTPVPIPQVPSVPHKQLQKEPQLVQQKRAFPQPGHIRTITRESQTSTPTQHGNGNVNGASSVRKETPVFPPKHNCIPSVRRESLAQARTSPPAQPKSESTTTTSSSGNGIAARTRSGTGASTSHQNHFAGLPVELPNFVTQMQKLNNQERSRKEGGSGSGLESAMGDRIDKWTKKYEGMAVQQLLNAHKQLVEQNAEHNARMVAMMAVLIKKVDQVVGQTDGAENGS